MQRDNNQNLRLVPASPRSSSVRTSSHAQSVSMQGESGRRLWMVSLHMCWRGAPRRGRCVTRRRRRNDDGGGGGEGAGTMRTAVKARTSCRMRSTARMQERWLRGDGAGRWRRGCLQFDFAFFWVGIEMLSRWSWSFFFLYRVRGFGRVFVGPPKLLDVPMVRVTGCFWRLDPN